MRWIYCLLLATTAFAQGPTKAIDAVLDDWRRAAASADEARYFGHFAANGVFMGTDAQYNLSVPIPNTIVYALVKEIAAAT
jgi:hypothetical protein